MMGREGMRGGGHANPQHMGRGEGGGGGSGIPLQRSTGQEMQNMRKPDKSSGINYREIPV